MNDSTAAVALWLADYLLLTTALLIAALAALASLRQPAQRLAVTKSTLIALSLLAALCTLPNWSLVHLISNSAPRQPRPVKSLADIPRSMPATDAPAAAPSPLRPHADLWPAPPRVAIDATPPGKARWRQIPWTAAAVSLYLLGSLATAVWLSLGSIAASRLICAAVPAPSQLASLLNAPTASRRRKVRLLVSPSIDVAVAIGTRRPAILLPKSLADDQSASHNPTSAIQHILAHELAHITNRDLHWLAVSRTLLVLLWPQPLYWLLRRRMRLDQEALADAAAADVTSRQSYAEQLVAWARRLPPHPAPRLSTAVGLWEGPSQLRQRIALLVDEHFTILRNCSRRLRLSAALAAVAAALVLSLVTLEPGHSQPPTEKEPTLSAADAERVAAAVQLLRDTEGIGSQMSTKIQPAGRAHVADDWASAVRTLADVGRPAVPTVIAALDAEQRDHPISKLAFTLRAIGDPRAVPALIRAIPRTLCPGRSDYGLQIEDRQLLRFMQQHDLNQADTRENDFDYGRSFREVVGALHKLTGTNQNDMELNWVHLAETPQQQVLQRQLFQKLAQRWADWWSQNWQKFGVGDQYADVALPPTADAALARQAPAALPVGTNLTLTGRRSEWIVESAHESGQRCFVDLDTAREAGWPAELPPIDQVGPDSEQVLAWAREQGFDLVGITFQPPGYDQPLYCLQPLEMTVWQLTPDELRDLPRAMRGEIEYPVHLPVDRMVPHVIIDEESGEPTLERDTAFVYLTREGTAGLLRMTAQVTDTNVQTGKSSSPDDEYSPVGFHRGAKISFATITESDQPAALHAPALPAQVLPNAPAPPAEPLDIKNRPREAAAALTRALNRQPDDPVTLLRRSEAWQRLGEYKSAIADLERVLPLNEPTMRHVSVIAHNNLAYLLATAPDDSLRDGKRAVRLAQQAIELAPVLPQQPAELFDTLAAAYAETGDFEKALEAQTKAIELAPNDAFREHLKLYESRQPRREAPPPAALAPGASAVTPTHNTILGRTEDEHGRPLADVEVFLFRVKRSDQARRLIAQTTTDENGVYRFDNVIDIDKEFPGRKFPTLEGPGDELLQLAVRKAGRVSEMRLLARSDVAQRGDFALIKMPPAATLQGRVTGPDGRPVAGALIFVDNSSFDRWEGAKSARTDADGNYAITDVAAFDVETYRKQQEEQQRQLAEQQRGGATGTLTLFHAPPMLTVEHPEFALKKVGYDRIPGTADVRLDPPAVIEGRVLFADSNQPAANVLVNATTMRPTGPQSQPQRFSIYDYYAANVRTDAQGRYRFTNLPAGSYDLWAEAPEWVNVGLSNLTAPANQTTVPTELILTRGGLLRIRLVDAKTGRPLVLPPHAQASLTTVPKQFVGSRSMFYQPLDPSPDGTFELRVLPGENTVFLAGVAINNEYKWAGATSIGLPPPEATVADGQTVTVEVPAVDANEAQAKAATGVYRAEPPPSPKPTATNEPKTDDITGQILHPDGTPAAGIRVIAFSMHDPDNISKGYGYQRTRTDENGRFQLSIYAGGKEVFWILPTDYAQQTHIINDRRGDLGVFQLENGLHLHGRVLDQNGKPIPDIWVNAELRGGPSFRKIEMPVADNIERASLTDALGHFDLGPLPPGTYKVYPDEEPEDDFEHIKPHKPLPAAFVPREVELSAASELDEIEIRPVDSVTIEVRFVDSKGRPTRGNGFFLIGTMPDGTRVAFQREQENTEPVVFTAPKGLENTILDFPLSSMRIRRSPDEPWENDHSIKLGTLESDGREIQVVRYRAPTLIVSAKDRAEKPIPGLKPAIYYRFKDKKVDRQDRWIGEFRGDITFEPTTDGRWLSEYLLPDEEFTLTVTADGYQSVEQSLSLAEAESQEMNVTLQRADE